MTTMTSARPYVTGGVDTHRDLHVAAALDPIGGVLGTAPFPTTAAGYRALLERHAIGWPLGVSTRSVWPGQRPCGCASRSAPAACAWPKAFGL